MKKTVLITGAATGIGKETAKIFAQNNYNLILTYHNHNIDELVNYLNNNYDVEVLTKKIDLESESDIKELVGEAINKFGRVDVLVNNAAIELNSEFKDKTKEDFLKTLNINLVAPFLLSKYVSKYMLEKKEGYIINISSNNALDESDPSTLEYDASKAGLISLTHNLAKELSPYVNVNAIAPGWVMTEKVKSLNDSLNGMLEETEKERTLINRFVKPEEVASLVYFLTTNKAINNEVIRIDGGIK